MFNILVVEDEKYIRKLIETVLKREGYWVYVAENGKKALELMDTQHIDLIVLDIMMPDMDGYELTRIIRDSGSIVPIVMTTAKSTFEDKKMAFSLGVDDYMTKPIDTGEMLLRIKAILRRAQMVNERRIVIGEVIIDYDTLTVSKGQDKQTLPQKEFYLLNKLLSYPDRVFTRIQLMDEIWGMDSDSSDTTVNVHINRLRKRFKDYPEFDFITVRGLGYKAVKNV